MLFQTHYLIVSQFQHSLWKMEKLQWLAAIFSIIPNGRFQRNSEQRTGPVKCGAFHT